ncbi:MAG TPA: trehalose-phosphatase [bacterium]|jgi:trehalose-phosphatase|nr:trehalose-phosphatase [bacterium]
MRPGSAGLHRFDALAVRSPLVLAMDFDGTLAPLVRRPSRARMPARVQRVLAALARLDGVVLALISGRSLADLKRRCAVRGALLVGAHGASSSVPGIGMSSPESRRWNAVMRRARAGLRPLGLRAMGVRIEDKGLGLTLHLGKPGHWGLERRVSVALEGLPVRLHRGFRVLEVRPLGPWHKGLALSKLADACAPGWRRKGACLFTGDDATDEDAFRALPGMGARTLGLKIGSGASAAGFRVKNPRSFWRLLDRILILRSKL